MNEVIERLNNYLSGYKYQYDYFDDNELEHCLDDDIKQLLKNIKKLQQENQELKKQLEELKYSGSCSFANICKNVKVANYNKQKEFIEWLEKMMKDMFKKEEYEIGAVYCYILEKYKEITGGDNNG